MKITLKKWEFIAICLYIVSLGLPVRSDIPMIILSSAGILSASLKFDNKTDSVPLTAYISFPFLMSVILSVFVSADIKRSLLLSLSFIPAYLLFFLVFDTADHQKKIYYLYLIFSVLGLLISLHALKSAITLNQGIPGIRIKNMGNPNLLVPNDLIILVIIIPFSLSLIRYTDSPIIGFFCSISILSSICIVIIYQSRGALILAGISFIVMACFLNSYKIILFCAIAVFAGLSADILTGSHLLLKFTGVWNTRIVYWLTAWEMFKDAPILGHGLHTYASLYHEYRHRISVPGWVSIDERFAPWTHNLYLEILSGQGITGLSCFVFLLYSGFKAAWNSVSSSDKGIRVLGIGILSSLLNFCLAAAFELSFVRHWVVMIFFSILGIIASLSYKPSVQKENDYGSHF